MQDETIERWANRALVGMLSTLALADLLASVLVAWWAMFGLVLAISIRICWRKGVLRDWATLDPEPMDWIPSEGSEPSSG